MIFVILIRIFGGVFFNKILWILLIMVIILFCYCKWLCIVLCVWLVSLIKFCLLWVWYKVIVNVFVVLVWGVFDRLSKCLIICCICVLFVFLVFIIVCLICCVEYLCIFILVCVVVIIVVFLVWLSFNVEFGLWVKKICFMVR